MKLIGENIHIISGRIREAIGKKDEEYIAELIKRQQETEMDYIDLNVGPAKRDLEGSLVWLTALAESLVVTPLSLDSTNVNEIELALSTAKNPQRFILNSTNANPEKLERMSNLASKYGTKIIALTMNEGIPKEADTRLELAFEMVEVLNSKGIKNENILFDPLILPISADQLQATQALNAIRMFKESFDPVVNTVVGLSNVSNGSPKELRPLINQTFLVLAHAQGLDMAILDAFDTELLRINKLLQTRNAKNYKDEFILCLTDGISEFKELEEIDFDRCDEGALRIYKTAEILLNKKVYSHSYLEI